MDHAWKIMKRNVKDTILSESWEPDDGKTYQLEERILRDLQITQGIVVLVKA